MTDDLRLTVERELDGQTVRVTYPVPQPFVFHGNVLVPPDAEVELPDDADVEVHRITDASEAFEPETIAELKDVGLDRPYRRRVHGHWLLDKLTAWLTGWQ